MGENPNFNYPEFGVIEREAGTNRFIMSVGQWIARTKAIGLNKVAITQMKSLLESNSMKKLKA